MLRCRSFHARPIRKRWIFLILGFIICSILGIHPRDVLERNSHRGTYTSVDKSISLDDIEEYSGDLYVVINDNVPWFQEDELSTKSMEYYSELDDLGRCGVVYACIGRDIMPTEDREEISHIKPTGWHSVNYGNLVEGEFLYNRCHLIGFQLTGENANKKNLITGTRSMNADGMLPFENMVADYVKETGNHVLYRVTPMFDGDNLVADGVLMEAKSVEDNGEGILFNVFVYNVQDGVGIDYATGESWRLKEGTEDKVKDKRVVANKNSRVYHTVYCESLPKKENRIYFNSEAEANAAGYDNPCRICFLLN